MPPSHAPIPDIPGQLLEEPDTRHFLNTRVAELCGLKNDRFPGSQPVSFSSRSVEMLEKMDFWVCEKSDGVRVLLFVIMNGVTNRQEVWLIDRKQRYFLIEDMHFPHWENPDAPLTDTIVDGELVIDIDPATGAQKLRYYAFDLLVLNGESVMQRPLLSRYGRLRNWVIDPYKKALARYEEWAAASPFEIVAKKQELSYHISQVLNVHVPKLQHSHDGLIFTCAESEYFPGTDDKILKWKPPSENSIDFKLELRFPPSPDRPDHPDFYSKPVFLMNQWCGGDQYEFFDIMEVDDNEWQKMKESGEQYDGRVVEVCWDMDRQAWRMFRFRDDKPHGNHKSIVRKILASIDDGVEIDDVLAHADQMRKNWKRREATKATKPPQSQPQPQQRHRQEKKQSHNGQTAPMRKAAVAGLKR